MCGNDELKLGLAWIAENEIFPVGGKHEQWQI